MWGIKTLLIASACGSLRHDVPPGSLVLVNQHINLLPNPLIGPNEEALGPRWPHGKDPYSKRLLDFAQEIAESNKMPFFVYAKLYQSINALSGTYIGITGPSGSTRAELHAWKRLGAGIYSVS